MELQLYGEIGVDVLAKEVNGLKNGDTIRINSYGGDVFEALTIYNLIKDKEIKCVIDGICASAATLIACGCASVTMPRNAVYMIHEPSANLFGYMKLTTLENVLENLKAVRKTLITVYEDRTGISEKQIVDMLKNEAWLDAENAKTLGFIDEVTAKDEVIENKITAILNKGGTAMEDQTMYEKFKSWFKNEAIKEEETRRLTELEKVQTSSIAEQAIINLAKTDGRTLKQIQPELDAIAIAELNQREKARDEIIAIVKDYLESGAEKVGGSPVVENKPNAINEVVKYANEVMK